MEIKPKVDKFSNTENQNEYVKIIQKLNHAKKNRILKIFLSIVGGALCAAVPPILIAVLAAGTPVMSLSPLALGGAVGVCVATAGCMTTILFDNKNISELKRLERKYAPDIVEERRRELESAIKGNEELEKTKKENDMFLSEHKDEVKKEINTLRAKTEQKVKIQEFSNIALSSPVEPFDPKQQYESEKLKYLDEQKEKAYLAKVQAEYVAGEMRKNLGNVDIPESPFKEESRGSKTA